MRTITSVVFLLFATSLAAQVYNLPPLPVHSQRQSPQNSIENQGWVEPHQPSYATMEGRLKDYFVAIQQHHSRSEYLEATLNYKQEQNHRMKEGEAIPQSTSKLNSAIKMSPPASMGAKGIEPQIATNFPDYDDDYYWPNDNDIAVSEGGQVVTVQNGSISVFDENGNTLLNNSLFAFFGSDWNFTGSLYDPHIIYDNVQDRFILVCLDGNNSATNKCVVAFSETSDATGNWWYYWYNAAQNIQSNVWMDFPLIGINADYLTVSGNMFYDDGTFFKSVVLRFEKNIGYQGGTLGYYYWYGMQDDQGNDSFTLCPLSYGAEGEYNAAQSLFVSTLAFSGDIYQFWILDNATNMLNGYAISSNSYSIGADAIQLGSSMLMDAGDCRVSSGFYLYDSNNGTGHIHFTFTSTYEGSGYHNGAIKARIDWTDQGFFAYGVAYGYNQGDYTHPSIAYFGNNVETGDVVICAAYSALDYYPTSAVFALDNYNWASSSTALHFGEGAVFLEGQDLFTCRWGDYTGLARKFGSSPVTLWAGSSYGKTNGYSGTWVAEIGQGSVDISEEISGQKTTVYPNPANEKISASFRLENNSSVDISLYDRSGREVAQLYHGLLGQGDYTLSFGTDQIPSGEYLVQIRNGKITPEVLKVVIVD